MKRNLSGYFLWALMLLLLSGCVTTNNKLTESQRNESQHIDNAIKVCGGGYTKTDEVSFKALFGTTGLDMGGKSTEEYRVFLLKRFENDKDRVLLYLAYVDCMKDWSPNRECPKKYIKSITYYGYYGDLDADGNNIILEEEIELNYLDNYKFEAIIKGVVTEKKKKVVRSWLFSGFDTGSRIVAAYRTNDPKPKGTGVYFLTESYGDYTGTWQGVDCVHHKILRCPYLLISDYLPLDQVKDRWKTLFAEECTTVSEAPGNLCK